MICFSLCGGSQVELIRHIASLPNTVDSAARDYDPSRITRYSQELATLFHKFYDPLRRLSQPIPAPLTVQRRSSDKYVVPVDEPNYIDHQLNEAFEFDGKMTLTITEAFISDSERIQAILPDGMLCALPPLRNVKPYPVYTVEMLSVSLYSYLQARKMNCPREIIRLVSFMICSNIR